MELVEISQQGQIETMIVKEHSRLNKNPLIIGQAMRGKFCLLGYSAIAIIK